MGFPYFFFADEEQNTTEDVPRKFLQYDSGPRSADRITIWTTDTLLEKFSTATIIAADGNFKTCPNKKLVAQIYFVRMLIERNGTQAWVAAAFGMLPRKDLETYRTFFRELKNLCEQKGFPTPRPVTLIMDLEMAAMQAARNIFPGLRCQLCFYHLCQCTFRYIYIILFRKNLAILSGSQNS